MTQFLKLTMLSNDEPLILALNQIVAIQGSTNGTNVFVTGGLNQWFSVKESIDEIFAILKNALEY